MSYMITADCINCNACLMDCPVNAISSGPSRYVIDPDVCVDCEGYYPVSRCLAVCPVDACVPAREPYLLRAATLVARGRPPEKITASGKNPPASAATASSRAGQSLPDRAELERELALLEREQRLLTNKETLAAVQYKIAKLQWRLGLIGDADLASAEEFHETFCYEADR